MGRVLFFGDERQAIFGFTGADTDSVEKIANEFSTKTLPLTVTYRCPKKVVAEARRAAIIKPYLIEAHPSAPEGEVATIEAKHLHRQNLTKADAILCRNTKPLVELAFALIRRSIPCHVEGRDIGAGLLKLATRWKVKNINTLRERLENYKEKQVAKLIAKGKEDQAEGVKDRVETVLILMEGCDTVQCVKDKIERLFSDTYDGKPDNLTLSTVHKSKGREWHRVFILGMNELMPSKYARSTEQKLQEENLKIVAVTRAKHTLVYADTVDKSVVQEDEKGR